MKQINTMHGHDRMPTRQLLQEIATAVAQGENEFFISASGQHDIGGPLWNNGELTITVTNPGQRVGAMCLPGTKIIVQGSAPADVGWLNSGGQILILGDCGDTAGHCAASGCIQIAGRAGTRSGSLMKHDPMEPEPELWVLGSVGSFSFEFMAGGKAVVCGVDCDGSALGERPCVGMVGGCVYLRGPVGELTSDVQCLPLDSDDMEWLGHGLPNFLANVKREDLLPAMLQWEAWRKLVPAANAGEDNTEKPNMAEYRSSFWVKNGIFSDLTTDDFGVVPLAPGGKNRLRKILQGEGQCKDCHICAKNCPRKAISRQEEEGKAIYLCNQEICIGCGICAALCPAGIWQVEQASRAAKK